jgi:hypothetical protein
LRLFAGYCERRGLAHPEIDRFLNHLWMFVGLSSDEETFRRWVENEPPLTHAGLGDPYPVGFDQVLAAAGVPAAEFRQALGCTTEVLYGSVYAAADEAGSRRFVGELAALVASLGVSLPDTRPFTGSRWSDGHGWGARPSAEELATWRGAGDNRLGTYANNPK